MTDLERLRIAEGGGDRTLLEYESMFRKFVDISLGELGCRGFERLSLSLFFVGKNDPEAMSLSSLAGRASLADKISTLGLV